MNQKSLAIITARGGSKRIPRKNIKDFAESRLWHIRLMRHLKQDVLIRSWCQPMMRK